MPNAHTPAYRYANWSIGRLFPWHFTGPDRYATTTLCGRTMKTPPAWSFEKAPYSHNGRLPRYCVECVDALCGTIGRARALAEAGAAMKVTIDIELWPRGATDAADEKAPVTLHLGADGHRTVSLRIGDDAQVYELDDAGLIELDAFVQVLRDDWFRTRGGS